MFIFFGGRIFSIFEQACFRNANMFVLRSRLTIKGEILREKHWFKSKVVFYWPFQGGSSAAGCFFYIIIIIIIIIIFFGAFYVTFELSLFGPHLSFFWCLGRDVYRDCGILEDGGWGEIFLLYILLRENVSLSHFSVIQTYHPLKVQYISCCLTERPQLPVNRVYTVSHSFWIFSIHKTCSDMDLFTGSDLGWFLKRGRDGKGVKGDLFKLAYLLYVFGKTSLSKQCRPRSDAVHRSVWSGSTLFATHPAILYTFIGNKMNLLKIIIG